MAVHVPLTHVRESVTPTPRGMLRSSSQRVVGAVVFFVLVPVMIGFPMGWYQAGLARYMTIGASCAMWVCQWLVSWWLPEGLLRAFRTVLAPWKIPFLVLLLIAAAANLLLSRYYGPALVAYFIYISGSELPEAFRITNRSLTDYAYLRSLVTSVFYGQLYWIVLRFAYERWRHSLDKAGTQAEPPLLVTASVGSTKPSEPPARILAELRRAGIASAAELIAIHAEDHYVRLYTSDYSRLVLYRFADILTDLRDEPGLQVHRSYWVRLAAISRLRRDGGAMELTLTNGMAIPVSHKHRGLLDYLLKRDEPPQVA